MRDMRVYLGRDGRYLHSSDLLAVFRHLLVECDDPALIMSKFGIAAAVKVLELYAVEPSRVVA